MTIRDVNQFEWYDTKAEALSRAKAIEKQGKPAYIGGKRARSKCKFRYHDLKIAAIYHNAWTGSGKPWVIAWHD